MADYISRFYGEEVPEYFIGAGKTFIKIAVTSVFDEKTVLTVRVKDVVRYYGIEARNITSGCRTLAGFTGDWRPIDQLAKECLEYFKAVNRPALVREGKKFGMTLG